ncbi:hypothetical protein [Bradyrhizobium sp. LTSPM299]|nr:hypothetical protein [Bradyrhizobium sp. LTSPM299]
MQPLLEFKPAAAGHAYIGNQAVKFARSVFGHERLRTIERAARQIEHQ